MPEKNILKYDHEGVVLCYLPALLSGGTLSKGCWCVQHLAEVLIDHRNDPGDLDSCRRKHISACLPTF